MSTQERLLRRWTARGYPGDIGTALLEKYAERHRRYHTQEHLRLAFDILDSDRQATEAASALSPVDREALELAVWYHDREYVPGQEG